MSSAGCPDRLLGRHEDAVDLSQKVYRGMSQKSSMRGKLQTWRTQREREARKSADICCYHWFNYCSGRPVPEFADFDSAKASGLPGWQRTRRVSKSSLEDRPRAEIADELALQWLHDGHDEHASVAAFARTILELIAVGAPADLLTSHQRAMADEIEHAQACYQLAARFGVDQAGPAALPLLMPRAGGLTSVALAALHEACIGETIAALRAKRQLQHCEDPSTRKALQRIAHDEAKHAALGWQTLRWALANGDEQLVASLRNEIAQLQQQWAGASDRSILPGSPNELANWGRLNAEQIDACQRDAWRSGG